LEKTINLQIYGGIIQSLFIAQEDALDTFVPQSIGDFAFLYIGEGLIQVYQYISSGGEF
jgi:hypothetical protein